MTQIHSMVTFQTGKLSSGNEKNIGISKSIDLLSILLLLGTGRLFLRWAIYETLRYASVLRRLTSNYWVEKLGSSPKRAPMKPPRSLRRFKEVRISTVDVAGGRAAPYTGRSRRPRLIASVSMSCQHRSSASLELHPATNVQRRLTPWLRSAVRHSTSTSTMRCSGVTSATLSGPAGSSATDF